MTRAEGTFDGVGGVPIRWERLAPDDGVVRGVVVLVHGYAEHVGRYADWTRHLTTRGLAVTGLDHRGHGRSGGPRGHARDFGEMVADVRTLVGLAETSWPGVPRILFGHSMGGLIGFLYLLAHPETVRAGALSAPAFRLAVAVPRARRMAGALLARLAPRTPFTSDLDPSALSRDPAVGAAYVADPLVHRVATAAFFRAFLRAQGVAEQGAATLRVPVLVLQGDADRLVDPAGAQAIGSRLAPPSRVEMLPGYFHELLNEPPEERAKVIATLDAWFDRWFASQRDLSR